jgi:cyclase
MNRKSHLWGLGWSKWYRYNTHMKTSALFRLSMIFATAAFLPDAATAAVEPVRVANGVYVFKGPLANCTAIVTEKGIVMVDSGETPEFGAELLASVKTLSDKPVRYLVNTHLHFDHTNGNAAFADAGARIIAQENTFVDFTTKVSPPNTTLPPEKTWPTITLKDCMTLFFGNDEVLLFHPETGGAHTRGDVVVYYKNANVLATGDIIFNEMYPSIDSSVGGYAFGMAQSCREAAAMIDDKTIVIPGHGQITDKKGLLRYADMIDDVTCKVRKLMDEGRTLDEIVATHPTKNWDEMCSHGNMPPAFHTDGDLFTRFVFWSLQAHDKAGK